MTTPATFLAVFCGFLAAVEFVRLLRGEDRDAVDVGTTLVVVGITLGASGRAAGDLSSPRLLPIGLAAGTVAVIAGVAIVVRSWPGGSGNGGGDEGSSRRP